MLTANQCRVAREVLPRVKTKPPYLGLVYTVSVDQIFMT